MKKQKSIILLIIAVLGAAYFLYAYVLNAKKHALEAMLERFRQTVAAGKADEIAYFLQNDLATKATVALNVEYSITGFGGYSEAMDQTFRKGDFIRFVNLTLYPLEKYALQSASIKDFVLKNDVAHVILELRGTATGSSYMLGIPYPTVYTIKGPCEADVQFSEHNTPLIENMDCKLRLVGERARRKSDGK